MLKVSTCYEFDLLNSLNLLTKKPDYAKKHPTTYSWLQSHVADETFQDVEEITKILETDMLSPFFALVFSSLENFPRERAVNFFSSTEKVTHAYSESIYYNEESWKQEEKAIAKINKVIESVERSGFYGYWEKELLPSINKSIQVNTQCASSIDINGMLTNLTPINGDITLYLQALAAPFGIKICGNNYISDVSYESKDNMRIAIHEMLHPPYGHNEMKENLRWIYDDPFIKQIFSEKNVWYSTIEGFIEENVVEALEVSISMEHGLITDGYDYLAKHDSGSHVFSVILLELFRSHEKDADENLQDYIIRIVRLIEKEPLEMRYNDILQKRNCLSGRQ